MSKRSNSPYPDPLKGPLSDGSQPLKPTEWAGKDPDKNNHFYFIVFLIVFVLLFFWAVDAWTGWSLLDELF